MTQQGKLFFLCGKMGAGKSTMSAMLATKHNAVLISEDEWLSAHYPEQIHTVDDYIRHARHIKPFIKSHTQRILNTGTDVVMDFPANTAQQRAWFVELCQEVKSDHQLLYLERTDSQCLANIAKRRDEQPDRAKFDTEAVFHHITQFFEPPRDDELLNIKHHKAQQDE